MPNQPNDEKTQNKTQNSLHRSRKMIEGGAADVSEDEKNVEQTPPMLTKTEPSSDNNKQETGGPEGPEPTRYGDWEKKGRCIDF